MTSQAALTWIIGDRVAVSRRGFSIIEKKDIVMYFFFIFLTKNDQVDGHKNSPTTVDASSVFLDHGVSEGVFVTINLQKKPSVCH